MAKTPKIMEKIGPAGIWANSNGSRGRIPQRGSSPKSSDARPSPSIRRPRSRAFPSAQRIKVPITVGRS